MTRQGITAVLPPEEQDAHDQEEEDLRERIAHEG